MKFKYAESTKIIWWLGLILYVATGLLNIGIIATDDYEFGIARIIPAQNWTASKIIEASDIRSPIPNLYLFSFTKLALIFGVTDPMLQLRISLAISAVINYCLLSYFGFFLGGTLFLALATFYFICALVFTRPLIETLSTPYVFASVAFATRYYRTGHHRFLSLAILAMMVASIFRFQTGIVAPALLALVLLKRDLKGLAVGTVVGALAFVLSGLFDWFTKGSLHASLFAYAKYQFYQIHTFGSQPFYVFIGLFLLLSFPPTFFRRYPNFSWKRSYEPLLPTLLYFSFFVLAHSLITHKEERFMIPIFPLFLVLLTPLLRNLLDGVRSGSLSDKVRFGYFAGLNLFLLPFACLNVPQNNLISTARFLHQNPAYDHIVGVDSTLFNFPAALIERKIKKTEAPIAQAATLSLGCTDLLAIRSDLRISLPEMPQTFEKVAVFEPGILERIVIRLNPSKNARRSPIELYRKKDCRDKF